MLIAQSMKNLEYQVLKLSYVEVDRALAILKSMGYTVVEFKSGKGELAGEYSFAPSPSGGKNINQLAEELPENTQSIGLYVKKSEKPKIVSKLSEKGVDRFPDIGTMSVYANPWDGYLPMQHMVRWISY